MSIKDLEEKLSEVDENFRYNYGLLEARITKLEEKVKKKKRQDRQGKMTLELAKSEFIEDNPYERKDPFSNEDLAFWALLLLSKTNRKEIITTWPELKKRATLAEKVVNFFQEQGLSQIGARKWAKDYFEYVLLQHPTFIEKGEEKPMGYFTATSNFAISFYGNKMANENWRQVQKLSDESLD